MISDLQVPMARPLRGLRVHAVVSEEDRERSPRSFWLLSLREAAVRDAMRHTEVMTTLDSFQDAVAQLPGMVRQNLEGVSALATELGLAVAREIVGEAIHRGAIDPSSTVLRCLEDMTTNLSGEDIEVRTHPEDLSQVLAEVDRDSALKAKLEHSRFLPDPGLARGAVRIHTRIGSLTYDHREVLTRVSNEVRAAVADGDWDSVPAAEAPIEATNA